MARKSGQIAFFLMTEKGFRVLEGLISNGYKEVIEQVIIGQDAAIINDFSADIELLCIQHAISYSYRKDAGAIEASYAIAISWRWMIALEQTSLIVLHDSLLPKYRGFAPLVNQLINGEDKIGVTALFASADYDKGEIIAQKELAISYPIKISAAIGLIGPLYVSLVNDIVKMIKSGSQLKSMVQNEQDASYSLWRDEDDYRINWNDSAIEINRFIDAVGYPYLGASTMMDNKLVRIIDSEIMEDLKIENRQPGKIIFFKDKYPVIVCGKGLLCIKAIVDNNGQNLLPLKKFRTKFQ